MSQPNADIDHLLKLSVDNAKLSGVLSVEPHSAGSLMTRESLRAYLESRKIFPNCIDLEELDALIAEVEQAPTQRHERTVAKGLASVSGVNARVDFTPEIQGQFKRIAQRHEAFRKAQEENAFDADDDQNFSIDFYNESSVVIVARGDRIAKLTKSSMGEDGHTVFGIALAAKPGKEIDGLLDESCILDAQGHIVSQLDGHLTFENNKVRIHPQLDIAGNVDFSTGNIDFPGDVIVQKGVRDRFKVISNGCIEILKLVEAAHLNSQQDIILQQGMAGREIGTVNTVGNFTAGYLDAVHANIAGDCHIKSEVTNCAIQIIGSIDAPHASIRGGELSVSKGGIVGTIGSIQGVGTRVILAQLPDIEQKKRLALEMLPKVNTEITKRKNALKSFKQTLGKPNPEQSTEIWYMESEIDSLSEKLTKLELAIDRLSQIISQHTRVRLTVMSMIFARTELWLPGHYARFERDIKGEFTITLDAKNQPIIERGEHTEPLKNFAKINSDDRVLPLAKPQPAARKAA